MKMLLAINATCSQPHKIVLLRLPQHPQRECGLQTSPTGISSPIALRPGVATQGIGDTQAPTSVFTLHIGTVILSDEGVLNSHDKDLVLVWKFYDQSVAMASRPASRVMLHNFSTEYDIKVTNDFLNYMKNEEMPIILQLDHEKEPYARSTLPLRDALLHANERVDMSIELVPPEKAGSVGVLDMWYKLRVPEHVLPHMTLAVAQLDTEKATSSQRVQPTPTVMPRTDYKNNRESDLMSVKSQPMPIPKPACICRKNNMECSRANDRVVLKPAPVAADAGSTYDPSKYPVPRDRYAPPSASISGPPIQYATMQEDQGSAIIISEVSPKIKSPGDIMHAVVNNSRPNDSRLPPRSEYDVLSQTRSSFSSVRSILKELDSGCRNRNAEIHGGDRRTFIQRLKKASEIISMGTNPDSKKVTISSPRYSNYDEPQRDITEELSEEVDQSTPRMVITVLWLALNEECEAMADPHIQRLYVAYTFLGRSGAELETPVSLPKPKHYVDKCFFNFRKSFELEDTDFLQLGHMAQCRAGSRVVENENDCIIFSVISEPPEDPLGIESCEDIGNAYLYLGDLLAYSSSGSSYTEVLPVHAVRRPASVCGVLAVRVEGLDILRRCLLLNRT